MRKTFPVIALIAIIALSMMACNLPFFTQSAQTDIDQLSTAVAQTVQAQLLATTQVVQLQDAAMAEADDLDRTAFVR